MADICYACFNSISGNEDKCPHCGYINNSAQDEHYYLAEGTRLRDRYITGRVLGHGGFGITYIGLDTSLDVKVAIKEYLPAEIATRTEGVSSVKSYSGDKYDAYIYGLGRFMDEAKTLAKYNQFPSIVSITDFFEQNNTAYIVMEYLDGISLSEYLKRSGGKMSVDETLEIMRPVMDALREVHSHGMIHRDVSPDNIFITKNKQIKLLDFGAARHAMSEKSKSLSVVLKPGYAPPEQYYTKGNQGPWTDVYAVAATMYKCITGITPPEAMERVLKDSISNPCDIDKNITLPIFQAMNVSIDGRYKDISEFVNDLYSVESVSYQEQSDVSEFRATEAISIFNQLDISYNKLNSDTEGQTWQTAELQEPDEGSYNKSPQIIAQIVLYIIGIFTVLVFSVIILLRNS